MPECWHVARVRNSIVMCWFDAVRPTNNGQGMTVRDAMGRMYYSDLKIMRMVRIQHYPANRK